MNPSFELETPDHFTAGAVGPPGERVFYLQGRESGRVVTLKCEKEHVRALGEYLAGLLEKLPPVAGAVPADMALLEPLDPAWPIGSIASGYDQGSDRIVIVANELVEDEDDEDGESERESEAEGEKKSAGGATARFLISRAQATAFVARSRDLMKAGRPVCPMCSQAIDPGGHVCPRSNGHVVAHESA
jgi:uncharacterized repeat protein (TIGR03847 family)